MHLITRAQGGLHDYQALPPRGRARAPLRGLRPRASVHVPPALARPRAHRDLLVPPRVDHPRARLAREHFDLDADEAAEHADATRFLEVAPLPPLRGQARLRARALGDFEHAPDYCADVRGSLRAAIGFRYRPDGYLADMDDGFYSADYLRAWIRSAQLRALPARKDRATTGGRRPETGELLRGALLRGHAALERGHRRPDRLRAARHAPLVRESVPSGVDPISRDVRAVFGHLRPIKTAMDDESGIVESERPRRLVTNINIFALAPVAASHATPVRAPEIEPAETSETLVSPQWLERRNKKLDRLEQELRRRAAELDLREAELEQREAEFEAEAFIRSEALEEREQRLRSSTCAWTGARTSSAPTWRGSRAVSCAPTRSKRTPGLHSEHGAGACSSAWLRAPLEPRLPESARSTRSRSRSAPRRSPAVDQARVEALRARPRRPHDGSDDARGEGHAGEGGGALLEGHAARSADLTVRRSQPSASTRTLSRSRSSALRGSGVKVASVATAFPSGQSPLDIKLEEAAGVVELGADEIDMVIDRGAFLSGDYAKVYDEMRRVKEAAATPT